MEILTQIIPTGSYMIGDDSMPLSNPKHSCHVESFEIASTVISNQQFLEFVKAGGYQDETLWTEMGWRWQTTKQIQAPYYWQDKHFNRPQQPVVGVAWYSTMAFCTWLSRKTNTLWTLPTEAEWEVAVRGLTGSGLTQLATINSADKGLGYPIAVDKGHINDNGLVNMLGNVSEWTISRWGRNWQSLDYPYPYHAHDGREDPSASYARVIRGGSWFDPIQYCHPAYRARYLPGSRASNIGFRVVSLSSRVQS